MKYWRTLILIIFVIGISIVVTELFNNKKERVENHSEQRIIIRDSFIVKNEDNDTSLIEIDRFINRFMLREGLNGGATIVISKDGKVVYAKGYGFSNREDSILMQPYNAMRIASVSKLITAIAVIKLVEEGKLSLHQKVFGKHGILNDSSYLEYKDKRMGNVTVYHLLNHSGGWTARWGDPMFMPHAIARQMKYELPISMKDIIHFMQKKRMHFNPGIGSVYSNFGYGILGEIVTKVSGMSYEQYIKSHILNPLGVYDMSIGYSDKNKRLKNEVFYYEADSSYIAFDYRTKERDSVMVRRAYGGTDIQTLGSAGGWVASAIDLIKIILTVDGYNTVPDIISEMMLDTMVTCEKGFDPLGWRYVIDDNWYRSGTLAATSAMVARLSNGICYVVLLNSANHRGPDLATLLRLNMDILVKQIKNWPDVDLLENDTIWQNYLINKP